MALFLLAPLGDQKAAMRLHDFDAINLQARGAEHIIDAIGDHLIWVFGSCEYVRCHTFYLVR